MTFDDLPEFWTISQFQLSVIKPSDVIEAAIFFFWSSYRSSNPQRQLTYRQETLRWSIQEVRQTRPRERLSHRSPPTRRCIGLWRMSAASHRERIRRYSSLTPQWLPWWTHELSAWVTKFPGRKTKERILFQFLNLHNRHCRSHGMDKLHKSSYNISTCEALRQFCRWEQCNSSHWQRNKQFLHNVES